MSVICLTRDPFDGVRTGREGICTPRDRAILRASVVLAAHMLTVAA
jgi:hypothetical protein